MLLCNGRLWQTDNSTFKMVQQGGFQSKVGLFECSRCWRAPAVVCELLRPAKQRDDRIDGSLCHDGVYMLICNKESC
jgi:hypothetical protein